MKSKLEQTAVKAALNRSPAGVNHSTLRTRPRLHMSVEHAAIAQELTDQDTDLVLFLGRGWTDKQIAPELGINPRAVSDRVYGLRRKTRMSRASLAVLGYLLQGQYDHELETRPAA